MAKLITKTSSTLKRPAATRDLAAKIGRNLNGDEVIELISDLGGGKTTFVQGLAAGAGSAAAVTSPSFTIRNDYPAADFSIAHFDFYRLSEPGLLREMLAEAIADPKVVVVIEWADVVEDVLPPGHVKLRLNTLGADERQVEADCPEDLAYLFKGVF